MTKCNEHQLELCISGDFYGFLQMNFSVFTEEYIILHSIRL